ncbi:polyketide synthase [Annulohypoxylon truncatum]|uniref:polyketide synthase n=1 Tax=Annulohypoxylon truncatum TaxID=327061 RepID=UPI0020083489|nr:polyketide synthase [Annulohypoxylon truncatum]KAI1206598.1 polyketide synthase [Annulohypoxylon truncatum]
MEFQINGDGILQEGFNIQREPIAIVGMGCRLPGHVSSPSDLWDLLVQNKSGHCRVPMSRFNVDGFYHPDAERPGSINSTGGYFLQEDLRSFDNAFFGINNLEASYMDAQQRKLLEVVYESFENGGVPLSKIRGSKTGVYVGNFTNDYMIMQYKDPEYFSRYSATGSGPTVLSNRISHCFDLRGPSVVLDTACSSSMYALHFACLALDSHDCDAAVVASANLIQSAEQQLIAVKAGILSPDSTCHTFDESANGYGRADGASSLYLKRLSDAQRDGDPIRCIIRGTAVNGNGRTPGIVQPSIDGQEAVIRAAYRRACLPTDGTDYVEAHGTGTQVGDPIEIEAISRVFHHMTGKPTAVGGIKPNLGHSEGASGLSSIIKLALALEHGEIPATIGIKKINPNIKLDQWNLDIVKENRPWPKSRVARASVNSFGFGGANGHAILEAAPVCSRALSNDRLSMGSYTCSRGNGNVSTNMIPQMNPTLLTFSARTEYSMSCLVKNIADYVSRSDSRISLTDLVYTLNGRRSRLAARGFAIVTPQTLADDLDPAKLIKNQLETETLPLAFIFTGQGAQWPGMGGQLFHQYSKFRESIRYLDSCLAGLSTEDMPGWTLEDTLLAPSESSDIDLAEKSQPICTAVQVALIDLLKEWNIRPKVVIGHSSGEIGAAYAAGHLSAYRAIMAAYFRGRTVVQHARVGAMIAVGLGKEAAQTFITEHDLTEQISLACDNSPESTTLSGDAYAVEKLLAILHRQGIFVRKLKTNDKAYHSKHMKEIRHIYQQSLERVWHADQQLGSKSASNGDVPHQIIDSHVRIISSVTGVELTSGDMATIAYWVTNLESPVRFCDAVKGMFGIGRYHLLELGPHSALELPIKQIAASENRAPDYYAYNPALIRGKDGAVTLLSLVGSLFLQGNDDLPLENILPDNLVPESLERRVLTDLPHYSWDYTAPTLWTESRAVTEFRNRPFPRHDLLGSQIHGASKLTTTWRNIVDVDEVPWLKDHCLGPSVVFPAAAYLAMGAEAACQVNGIHLHDCPGIEMRHFNFLKAMDFHAEHRPRLEVVTEMRRAYVTSVLASDTWWHFTVSSISGEDSCATIHATGFVSLAKTAQVLSRTINLEKDTMEQQATRVWYDKFTKEGLNWGPKFAVMEDIYCDRARKADESLVVTHLLRGNQTGPGQSWQYIAHPISIDSMLQTAFVATTGGWVRELRATVPVKMDKVLFSSPSLLDMDLGKTWAIDARSRRVGFGTVDIDAELYNSSGETLIRLEGARCIAYQGNTQQEALEERNPMCRVAWRPDIMLMEAGINPGLVKYTDWFLQRFAGEKTMPESLIRLAGALDLCTHKNPKGRILLLNADEDTRNVLLNALKAKSPLRRFETFTQATFSEGGLRGREVSSTESGSDSMDEAISKETKFDIIFSLGALPTGVKDWMATPTTLITGKKVEESAYAAYSIKAITGNTDEPVNITIISERSNIRERKKCDVVMVNRTGQQSALDSKIHKAMESYFGHCVPLIGISDVNDETIPSRSVVISTIESKEPILSTISEEQMRFVKTMTDRASLILWVCHGDFMAGTNPEFAPVLGLSRAVMLEQPSLQFAVFDIDETETNIDGTAYNACNVMDQLMRNPHPELELSQKEQTIHSARWEPADELNAQFRLKQDEGLLEVPIGKAGRCQLHISHPGQMDTIHFISREYTEPLPTDYVEIEVKSVGLNAKDLYVLSAKIDTHNVSCSCECAGLVVNVGSTVTNFKPGDRVVAMAPGHFATHERLPQWAVCKLEDDMDFTTASTIPIVFSTVIYGLVHRANLQRGEYVLIHSAAGGVGLAAIQLANHIGAEIFATVGNESKKEFLVKGFGLDPERIFNSRDASFLPAIMKATGGQGVDVVLNSLTGELLRSSFEACADFGRFVEIGKRDILDDGSLNMNTFGKNVSFTAFDLSNLFYSKKKSHHDLWQRLLVESMNLIRNGIAKPCSPIETFRASEITQAFRHFSLGTRMGKLAVSFQDGADRIRVKPQRYETTLSPNKTYLMIGCLGGLGRSISKWMISRGAKSLVFLGRSGLKTPESKMFVDDLLKQGAQVEVFQGDVSNYDDVERIIQQAPFPIGGVIHAAMGLSEALWSSMSHASWHTSIAPKVRGSWNLHNVLSKDGRDSLLDFFIVTSSISGTVGMATESNYCAANSFLDAFARYRSRLGQPAVSIGYGMIAEVGYLHEHPDIEALLKRKGIHSITEDEMLQILDVAIVYQSPSKWTAHYDDLVGAHILTGIEFIGLKEQRDRGFEGDNHVLADPRASLLAAAFARSTRGSNGAAVGARHGLPPEVTKVLASSGHTDSVSDAVQGIVAKKIANLILLPVEQLRPEQKLGEFGIDSMLAAEFRTFIFHALGVDVPFITLLDKQISVRNLTQIIIARLENRELSSAA